MTDSRIRIALVDDQTLFRAGIRMLVSSQPDMVVVGEGGDGRDACALASSTAIDLVLMDVRMPEMDGIEATERILADAGRRAVRAPKIIVLTTFDHDEAAIRAIRAGASGFLAKHAEPDFLLASLRAVHGGDAVIAANATRELLAGLAGAAAVADGGRRGAAERGSTGSPDGRSRQLFEDLTERERAIFRLAARGLSNAEIATHEVRSEATVKSQMSRVLTKLGLRDRVQLVVFAFDNGLAD